VTGNIVTGILLLVLFSNTLTDFVVQQANKLVDGTSTPELRRRKLSRRLSSFSSLPNISLIRRKSSTNSNNNSRSTQKQASTESEAGIFSSFNSSIHSNTSSCASSSSASSSFKIYSNKKKNNITNSSNLTKGFPVPSSIPSSVKGVEELIANNINNVNCLVDEGMAGIRRAVINGIDTISLTDGSTPTTEAKCVIL
jgi:hypothetical protein